MGSKGRIPPHHMRHPLAGPGMVHPEPFGAGIRGPHGGFPPIDMLPPPEIMERKLAAQHMEMERLATENRRLAATHGTLRQQLAAAQQELQILDSQIGAIKLEREQQMKGLVERISKMEAELQAGERVKLELQQARKEAQTLAEVRQELVAKAQKVNSDLQRAVVDVQQLPALLSELNHLRHEFHECRATYEHERKVYLDHLESLQVMDKEYRTVTDEVAKLRAELNNAANTDKRAAYGGAAGYVENDASGHNPSVQSSYEDSYGVQQVHAPYQASGAPTTAPVPTSGGVAPSSGGTPTYGAPQPGPPAARSGYDPSKVPGYDAQRGGPTYDSSRGPAYDPQQGGQQQVYNAQRVTPGYDPYNRAAAGYVPYDPQRAAAAAAYEMPRGSNFDSHSRGVGPAPPLSQPSGQTPPSNVPYGSTASNTARAGTTGHEAHARGGNTARR